VYVFFAGQLLDGDILVGVFVAGEHVEVSPSLASSSTRCDCSSSSADRDLRERGHARMMPMREQPGDLIQHHQP